MINLWLKEVMSLTEEIKQGGRVGDVTNDELIK